MNTGLFEVRSEEPPVTVVNPSGVLGRIDAAYYRPSFLRNEARIRDVGCRVVALGSLILKGNYGSLPDSGDYTIDGVPLIRGTDLRSMAVTLESAVRVPEAYFGQFKKAQIHPGDLLLLAKGASLDRPDSAAMYPLAGPPALANGSIYIIRPDSRRVNPFFLLGYLGSGALLLQKRRASTNTGALYNDAESIAGFLVPLPDPQIQNYIGAKVQLAEHCRARALIERRIVADAFDELLLESRFSANQDLSRWVPGLEMITRWLNAGYYRRVYSDLDGYLRGMGIRMTPLERVARCNRTKSRPEGVIRYIEISDIDPEDGVIAGRRYCTPEDTPNNAQRILCQEDILMSTRRPNRGAVACVLDHDDGAFCSVFLARIQCDRAQVLPRYLQEYLRRPTGKFFIAQRCTETTYPVISEDDIETIPVPVVPREVQELISAASLRAEIFRGRSIALVEEAKADVAALIEGALDVDAILAGKLKAPAATEIPELTEVDA